MCRAVTSVQASSGIGCRGLFIKRGDNARALAESWEFNEKK